MMKNTYLFFVLCCFVIIGCNRQDLKMASDKVNLIFDTDLGPDYDDVGAMALLHALADSGQVHILATLSSNKHELTVPCIDVINTYFGRQDIVLGVTKNEDAPCLASGHQNKWTEYLPNNYPHRTKCSSDAPDAVKIYRKLLAEAPDKSVTICTVGFLTNLKGLLDSEADEYSSLSGKELIVQKVKYLISMGGHFPEGREYNLYCDIAASLTVTKEWPTEIVFCGFEIGELILTGKKLVQLPIEQNPVKDAYSLAFAQADPNGRMSWDQITTFVAIKGIEPYFLSERGTIHVNGDGSNTWSPDTLGTHIRLIEKYPPEQIAPIIEKYMIHQPIK